MVEYKNLFHSKFLVKLLISCISTIFLLTGLFLRLVSAQHWLGTMLCTETIQINKILFWSWQTWSGIIVTYDRTQYAIDIRTNDYITWGTDKWQKQRTKGKTSRQRVEIYKALKYEKTSAATLPPKMYEILRTTMIQFNWKLPACVFSSTIQQPFSFQRGEKRKSSSRSPAQSPL